MWVLTAIFQAIAQAIAWILPISESGHSAIFHDFSGRFTNACSQLTGVIHIGIAIGLIIAFYKLFINLIRNFIGSFVDLFNRRLDIKAPSNQRAFMMMTILSFAFFLFYLIPVGNGKNLFMLLHSCSYNGNLLGEGIWFIFMSALIIAAMSIVGRKRKPLPRWCTAVIADLAAALFLPSAGAAFMMGIFLVGILCGMSDKASIRYAVTMSVPVLIVCGIVELCIAVTKINIISIILALIISVLVSFFTSKVLVRLIRKKSLTVFALYDAAIGLVCIVAGAIELIIK